MTTIQDVWIQVYTANVPNLGHDRSVLYANHACDEFEKKFAAPPPAVVVPVLKTTEGEKK